MKIGIVGSGMVGSTSAYALVMSGVGREIVLVDRTRSRAEAEANDILHAVPFAHPLTIRAGDYGDLVDCRVVVIAAGATIVPGETRLQVLQRNVAVFEQVVPSILQYASDTILVVVSNPVDIMTHLAAHFAAGSGMPFTRVIGSGTMIDTARFRALLGSRFGVDAQHVHAYVIGEHGDSEVLTWSLATIAGMPLEEFARIRGAAVITDTEKRQIDEQVRCAGYQILAGKGATYYGIGSAVARIVDALLNDHRVIEAHLSRKRRPVRRSCRSFERRSEVGERRHRRERQERKTLSANLSDIALATSERRTLSYLHRPAGRYLMY
jgi:L-lactate dehydrogenase